MITTDLERLDPLPSPLQQGDITHVRRGGKDYRARPDQLPGGVDNRGPNDRPDLNKSVRFLTRTDPRFDPFSDHALDELDTRLTCLGGRCFVEFAGKDYLMRYDGATRPGGPSSGPQTWRDGKMAYPTPLVPCKWVAEDSPSAQVKDYTEYPAGYDFPAGFHIGAYVTGQTTEQFFKRRAPGGVAPAPVNGGDATYWELVSGTDVPVTTVVRLTVDLPEAAVVALYNDAAMGTYAGKGLYITDRADGTGTVYVPVLGNGAVAYDEAWLFNPDNADAPAQPVTLLITNVDTQVVARVEYTDARAVAAQLSGYSKAATARAITAADSIRTAIGIVERKADNNTAALGSAPAYVSITAAGVRNTTAATLSQALGLTGDGGTIIVNRSSPGVAGNTLLGRNLTLDLQGHPLDLQGADLHMYSGARVINAGLIHNGRIFVRDGNAFGIQSIQGGTLAAQIYTQSGTAPLFRLYGTQVVNFGGSQLAPATLSPVQNGSVGNLSIELYNGAAFVDYPPAPQTAVVSVASSVGGTPSYQCQISDVATKYFDVVLKANATLTVTDLINCPGFMAQVLHTDSAAAYGPVRTTAADINADLTAAFATAPASVQFKIAPASVTDTARLAFILFTLQ